MEIPQEQMQTLENLASSGDDTAKEWLSELRPNPQPVKTGDGKEGGSGAADKGDDKGAEAPPVTPGDAEAAKKEPRSGVDPHRDGDGDAGKKPSVYDTIKELRRERRELRAERENSRKREEQLNARLAQLETHLKSLPDGDKAKPTEEDDLTRLLTKPGDFLAEREKKLIAAVREAIKGDLAQARAAQDRREQRSSAIKIFESIPNFDLDENEDQVFELMKAEYGWDEDDVEFLLSTRPEKTAASIKRAWEKKFSTALPEQTKSDKAAAKGVSVGGGGAKTYSKPTLADLNARAKSAKSQDDLDQLWEEAEKLLS